MHEADRIFTEKNLLALSYSYQVDAAKALEIQARLYPNPVASVELNMLDPQNEKIFNTGRNGQKVVAVDQLILLGGKRRSEIALSRQNTAIAELELEDLLRNLQLELHTNLYQVYFNELAVEKFNQQLGLLDSIITSYDTQARKGNIPYKEVIRLKSVYIRINNEKTAFLLDILAQQRKLQVLLQSPAYISPRFDLTSWSRFETQHPLDSLTDVALTRRPDFRIAQAHVSYANLNLQYQRRLAVPNVNVGAAYDQRGGAFNNQVGLSLSMPLPLTHRNQGNIKFAEHQNRIVLTGEQQVRSQIAADVANSWRALNQSIQEYSKARAMYNEDFNTVFTGVSDNFRRRNITLLEFVDFFESYNETLVQLNHIERQVALTAEELNHSIGYPLY
jgi:cobalt-zinc-cadmium efflux system outer membrane protein